MSWLSDPLIFRQKSTEGRTPWPPRDPLYRIRLSLEIQPTTASTNAKPCHCAHLIGSCEAYASKLACGDERKWRWKVVSYRSSSKTLISESRIQKGHLTWSFNEDNMKRREGGEPGTHIWAMMNHWYFSKNHGMICQLPTYVYLVGHTFHCSPGMCA